LSHHETEIFKESSSALEKQGHHFVLKHTPNYGIQKGSNNYRSMTSLMNKPTVPRKFSLQKERFITNTNENTSFAIKTRK
jgi:hypothetical protein